MKYAKGSFESASVAASNASRRDGRLRFVVATALGYTVSTRRVKFQDCWVTNGSSEGVWKAFEPTAATRAAGGDLK